MGYELLDTVLSGVTLGMLVWFAMSGRLSAFDPVSAGPAVSPAKPKAKAKSAPKSKAKPKKQG